MSGPSSGTSLLPTDAMDLGYAPRCAPDVVLQPVGEGAVAWAAVDRNPLVLDAAGRTLLEVFDGQSTLQQVVDDLEAVLPDADPEIDLGLGVLVTAQRFGLEALLDGVLPVPPPFRGRSLHDHLTGWVEPGVIPDEASSRADDTLGLGRAEVVGIDFPASPVRVSSTRPELTDLLRTVLPDRLHGFDGVLFLALADGDAQRVGRPFFTLYGPNMDRLVMSADLDEVLQRALNHLALPLWVHEERATWWNRHRTVIHPDGTAILVDAERLGQQVGLQRALERAGFAVVDRLLTAIDPDTLEIVLHPPRFGMQGVELGRDAVGDPRRLRIGSILVSQNDRIVTGDQPEVFTKGLAMATSSADPLDRQQLLAGMAEVATSARRIWLGQATPREVVDVLLDRA